MWLTSLQLTNWRNLASLAVSLEPGLVLVLGANGQGKTNLLEAVYALLRGASFRAQHDDELIRFGCDAARVAGSVITYGSEEYLELFIVRGKRKSRRRSGKPMRGEEGQAGLAVVLFQPQDLAILQGGPATRRRFLDEDLGGVFPAYQATLRAYRRVLLQRNAALARGAGETLLETLDEALLHYGDQLGRWRQRLLREITPYVAELYHHIAPADALPLLRYRPNLPDDPVARQGLIRALRAKERARGLTLWGPQRDDIEIAIGENDARTYASQGQQRSLAIALKMAALRYAEATEGYRPLLLMDDVLSELDGERRRALLSLLGEGQTILTTAEYGREWGVEPRQVLVLREGRLAEDGGGILGRNPDGTVGSAGVSQE